jgi:hypothetical protein
LVLQFCPCVVFPSRITFVEEMLPTMVIKTMQLHVMLGLVDATTLSICFDIFMSKGGVDTFVLVINYLNESWMPQHVTIGLFEVHETTMASQLCSLL